MTRTITFKPIRTTTDVWLFLKGQGGLDEDFYDRDIVSDLRIRLHLDEQSDFTRALRDHAVSLEDFIVAFFQAVQPYAEMMSELLAMFEKAGAKQGGHNLAVEFNFDPHLPALKFDLNHFRDNMKIWKTVAGTFIRNSWDSSNLWALSSAFEKAERNAQVRDPQFQKWIDEYEKLKRWPEQLLPPPRSHDPDLDASLSRAWQVWSTFVSACKKYGTSTRDVVDARFRTQADHTDVEVTDTATQLWPLSVLGLIESDYWAGSFARRAYREAERISSLSPDERREDAAALRSSLDNVIARVPQEQFQGEMRVQQLLEFLNLPLWRKRHELYSAWISTQILAAMPDPVRIHQVHGRLAFAFSGTHLATSDAYEPRLHVWAELRSPLTKPRGKSRKQSIQPDYSLITDPVTSAETSILEVECKQYRRPSARNFSDALTDYARGRPNAQVILVNYGRVDEGILEHVDSNLRDRTHMIGNMHPGSAESLEHFQQLVREAIQERYGQPPSEKERDEGILDQVDSNLRDRTDLIGNMHPGSAELQNLKQHMREGAQEYYSQLQSEKERLKAFDVQQPAKAVLSWGTEPRELDLYLRISMPGQEHMINYSNKGNQLREPWSQWDADVQGGAGPQTIRVAKWMGSKYRFAVHNFSNDRPLASCGAILSLTCMDSKWEFVCPSERTGKWWSCLEIDGVTGEIKIINTITDVPWVEIWKIRETM